MLFLLIVIDKALLFTVPSEGELSQSMANSVWSELCISAQRINFAELRIFSVMLNKY